jgi:hypothetical protein
MSISLHKILSKNDTGETGGHQDGFHIPKTQDALSFFPQLAEGVKNPRAQIIFLDPETNEQYAFSFIYYNNRLFGGTRNEYRLTRVARYIRRKGLSSGDTVMLNRINSKYVISYKDNEALSEEPEPLRLSGKKKVVYI